MSFRIDPRLPLTAEVRRIAKDEIEAMLRHLASAAERPDKAMHGCRKRIKRLRAPAAPGALRRPETSSARKMRATATSRRALPDRARLRR